MLTHSSNLGVWVSITLAGLVHAHSVGFHEAMFCINGTDPSVVNYNNNLPVMPLWNLTYSDYWFHHVDKCDEFPPDEGVFLELNAGGSFTVEMADNRAHTSLNPNAVLTDWGDGLNHIEPYCNPNCITQPNLHTRDQDGAAGTSFAIAYESEVSKVTPENLVVFTVRYNTPWHRVTTFDVPADLPACPDDQGCLCTFNWVPDGCGEPNMYMFPYRCKVFPGPTPKTIGSPQPARWCGDDINNCVQGPKQVMIWNQLDGNNVNVSGTDQWGKPLNPMYNWMWGFPNGVQNDIFVETGTLAASTPTTWFGTSTSPTSGTAFTCPTALPSSSPATNLPTVTGTSTPPASAPADNLPTGSGTPTLPASAPPSNLPTGSGTPSAPPSYLPTGSGTPSAPPSYLPTGSGTPSAPPSYLPTGSGAPSLPASAPPSYLPTGSSIPSAPPSYLPSGSGAPSLPVSAPPSYLPTGSGTPSLPASASPSYLPTGSGTGDGGTCNRPAQESAGAHSKRMRRGKRDIF